MVHYKLTYFVGRGYGEPARLMFRYAGIEFEDVRLEFDDWIKIKDTTPFGQIPILEVDGVVIAQSFAITRLVAKASGLYPENNVDAALADSIADYIKEIDLKGFLNYFGTKAGFLTGDTDKFLEEEVKPTINSTFPIITKWLKEAGNGYLTKSGLTFADFFAAEKLGNVVTHFDKTAAEWPEITQFVNRIYSLPNVKEYVASRPKRLF
uniref:Glutathione S-transferase n=1 Tax=Rhabditophanes sp. KR3021 TaxID=114890 RepID=A0AC35U2E4_9BILA